MDTWGSVDAWYPVVPCVEVEAELRRPGLTHLHIGGQRADGPGMQGYVAGDPVLSCGGVYLEAITVGVLIWVCQSGV